MKENLYYLLSATICTFIALVLLVIQIMARSFGFVFWLSVGLCLIGIGLFIVGISIIKGVMARNADKPEELEKTEMQSTEEQT